MRDLKIKPSMDTPKAKLKNPAPKDAESILKKHMDKYEEGKRYTIKSNSMILCATPPTAWRKICAMAHLGRRMPRGA